MRPGQKEKRNNVSQTGKEGAEGSKNTGRGRAGTSRDRVGRSPQWEPGTACLGVGLLSRWWLGQEKGKQQQRREWAVEV